MTTIPANLLDTVVTGDARELARLLPDQSVDLIHTDPPYPAEFERVWWDLGGYASRVLRPGGSLIAYCGHYQVPMALQALSVGELRYHWIGWHVHAQKSSSMAFRTVRGGKPFLWFARGRPTIARGFFWDTKTAESADKRFHEWGQPEGAVRRDIEVLTHPGGVVLEPFAGGGTVPAVCKQLGRRYVAFELDPATAERARQRIHDTQIPLFIPDPAPPPALCFDAEEVAA